MPEIYKSVEDLLKHYKKRPLTSLEIELRLNGKKSKCAIYKELKTLVKWGEAEKIVIAVGKTKIPFYIANEKENKA